MKVPPLNLTAEYSEIETEAKPRLERVLKGGHFILGEEVKSFETAFAQFIGTKFAIGVASGSDALLLSLMVLDIKPGDEVITTAFTFIATGTAIARLGAKPVFIDIDSETFNINPDLIEKKITKKTKAIIPVHLYGFPCDMPAILKIAQKHGLAVIEDCAQAAGAKMGPRTVGSFGDFGCFSFYPTKTLGACGDGGMVAVNDSKLNERLRGLRQYGMLRKKYYHDEIGMNSRLDEVQAAILNVKLKRLPNWNEKRRQAAKNYDKLIQNLRLKEIVIPKRPAHIEHVYHQYGIWTEKRDALMEFLIKNEIAAGIYYPEPLHLQKCFSYLDCKKGSLPETEKAASHVLNLPIYPQLELSQQEFVVSKIKEFYS